MVDPLSNNKERIALLRKACGVHQLLYRNAMAGKGIDRHMFGLYIACKGLGYVSRNLPLLITASKCTNGTQLSQAQIVIGMGIKKYVASISVSVCLYGVRLDTLF